jgi:hypothetical protein
MSRDRIRFRVRSTDERFECEARAEWTPTESGAEVLVAQLRRHDGYEVSDTEAAQALALSVSELRVQLRACAIEAHGAREREPGVCPLVVLRPGRTRSALPVLEGRLAS